ncbi:MAG: GntR family transcriptional regulator [Lentisphaeria bacterium]
MNKIINKKAAVPVYLQLKNWIEASIHRGDLLPGQRIPSENEFSHGCGIHRNTVRNALFRLEQEGLLNSVPGSGWFVRQRAKRLRRAGLLTLQEPELQTGAQDSEFRKRIKQGLSEGAALFGFEQISLAAEELQSLLNGQPSPVAPEALIVMEYQNCFHQELRQLKTLGLPVIFCNRQIFGEDIPCVCIDQYYGTRDLVTRLLQHGHQRVGCISMALEDNWNYATERYRGYADAFTSFGITPDRKMLCQIRDVSQSRRKIREFLKNNPDLTGLFIAGETFHQITLELLKKQGKRIPENLSIVAFDRVAGEQGKNIIALDQPLEEMGRRVFRTLDGMLSGHPANGEVLLPSITDGNSICKLNG